MQEWNKQPSYAENFWLTADSSRYPSAWQFPTPGLQNPGGAMGYISQVCERQLKKASLLLAGLICQRAVLPLEVHMCGISNKQQNKPNPNPKQAKNYFLWVKMAKTMGKDQAQSLILHRQDTLWLRSKCPKAKPLLSPTPATPRAGNGVMPSTANLSFFLWNFRPYYKEQSFSLSTTLPTMCLLLARGSNIPDSLEGFGYWSHAISTVSVPILKTNGTKKSECVL